MASPEAQKALSKAKIHLMSKEDTTFFSVVCLSLVHEWTDKLPTAATDGRRILYNERFFMSCSVAERVGIMLHEILHVVLLHCLPETVGDLCKKKANRAMDYAINLIIDKAGFKLPEGGLLDYAYDGMGWKEIYDLLDDEDDDDLPWDDLILGDGSDSSLKEEIDNIVVQAAQQAEMAGDNPGSIPGDIRRYIDKLTNPQVPWWRIMRGWFTQLAKVEYRFTRPNRRFFSQGILMPSLAGEKLNSGCVAVDVSGSISEAEFRDFISETASLVKDQMPEHLHFIQWDTRLTAIDKIEDVDELKRVKFTGGGGTIINPLMEWARDNKPNWMIVFTDGYFSTPNVDPRVPVIWVVHSNPDWKGPFGKTIHYTLKENQS